MTAPIEPKIYGVVPAAGCGSRMQTKQAKQAKQYLPINDQAILDHTLSVLCAEPRIERLVVCLAVDDQQWPALNAASHARISTTIGGATRAESVLNGLAALSNIAQPQDWVIVHDAARPCLSALSLSKLLDSLVRHPSGGLLAVPARDTLKRSAVRAGSATVSATLDRSHIWHAQTPQMFRYQLLQASLVQALKDGREVTDEASAMEQAGHEVVLVEGEQSNLKVTTPEDLLIAQSILQKAVQ